MKNFRSYGEPPYHVAVIHGGPGAAGEMAPMARRLAGDRGILEPLQTATTLDGQVEELRTVLENQTTAPVTLIGYSWGAWLSFIVAARYPALVRQLILVSSGPFEDSYVDSLRRTRMARLTPGERNEFDGLIKKLGDPTSLEKDRSLARLGSLMAKCDSYDIVEADAEDADRLDTDGTIFQGVWTAAAALRTSGALLDLADQIECPVVAIHGDYDPHPAAGVSEPLAAALDDFEFVLLERCGHTPWTERYASEEFYRTLDLLLKP